MPTSNKGCKCIIFFSAMEILLFDIFSSFSTSLSESQVPLEIEQETSAHLTIQQPYQGVRHELVPERPAEGRLPHRAGRNANQHTERFIEREATFKKQSHRGLNPALFLQFCSFCEPIILPNNEKGRRSGCRKKTEYVASMASQIIIPGTINENGHEPPSAKNNIFMKSDGAVPFKACSAAKTGNTMILIKNRFITTIQMRITG